MDNNGKYCDKTLSELKDILRQRKLKVAGKKKDLVERLLFDDRNSQKVDPVPEFHMSLPEASQYRDIHADNRQNFPNVTTKRVDDFFATCDRTFDEKIKLLYQQRYLRCVRAVGENGTTFITSVVWAEMKKSTSYKVDIALDANGVIQQTQCECAVGQGPSAPCKHVGCVLFGIMKYCSDGSILTEITCTQVLQQFHKSKPHKGSPLKATNLNQIRGKSKPIIYDPRPIHKRNPAKTEENLRNMVLNWQGKSKWPVLQKYEPANIRALACDHDYMEISWEDNFLRQEKISAISRAQVEEIELNTRQQTKSLIWTQERCRRLTASNFGVICKITDRRDIPNLLRTLIQPSAISSKSTTYGRKYENVAVEQYEKASGVTTSECGLFVSQAHPMLAVSPDRVVNENILVEVKCPYTARDELITSRTVPYLTEIQDTLCLKTNHNYYQVQGQLFCSGRKLCKFIVFTQREMKIIDIKYDEAFVDAMVTKLFQFYASHFKSAILNKFFYKL